MVEVIADAGEHAPYRYIYGSGCIVYGRTVLTAAHVVKEAIAVQVRDANKRSYNTVLDERFIGRPDESQPDLALIEITDPSVNLSALPLARLERGGTKEASVPCQAYGYPGFAEDRAPSVEREMADSIGVVPVLGKRVRGLLTVQLKTPPRDLPPAERTQGKSPWSGISGGPIIAEGRLLGVITEHAERQGPSTLTAIPISAIERNPARELWGPGMPNSAAWWDQLGATGGIADLMALPAGGPARRIIGDLPDFVPGHVRDLTVLRDRLLELLSQSEPILAELHGRSGVGKTAVAAELVRDRFAGSAVYLTALGYPGVAVATILDRLAKTVADPTKRQRLLERLNEQDVDSLTKLDHVLTTLGAERILLVIDSAEELVTRDGHLRDDGLAYILTEITRSRGHGVRILLVTTTSSSQARKPANVSRIRLPGLIPIAMPSDGRLPPSDYDEFAKDLTAGRSAILSLADLRQVSGRHPRRTELLARIPPGSIRRSDLLEADGATDLTEIIMATLDSHQARVVEVLAVCRRPVSVTDTAHLTGEPADAVRRTLDELADRRIARRYNDKYSLPLEEARSTIRRLNPDLIAHLTHRAAEYFEAAARSGNPRRLDGCGDWFNAIDLHIAARNEPHALALMATVDELYLREWGHSDVLMPWLHDLSGRLPGGHSKVLYASLLGRALVQQGRLDEGIASVYDALDLNRALKDQENQFVLLGQIAGYRFRAGQIAHAAKQFEAIIDLASTGYPWVAEARAGLALCQAQIGDLTGASRNIKAAGQDLAGHRGESRDVSLLEVRLWYSQALIELEQGTVERCLDTVSQAREIAAELNAVPLIARCYDLEARIHLYQNQPGPARSLAEEAWRTAARIGNPDLCRVAGVTLATALLRQSEYDKALGAARAAARYKRSLFAAEALAVEGVAAFCAGSAPDQVRLAFNEANRYAEDLLIQENRAYRAREASAIAWVGLALLNLSDDNASDGADFNESRALIAYRQAIEGAPFPGAGHRRRELFDILTAEQAAGTLWRVRKLLSEASLSPQL